MPTKANGPLMEDYKRAIKAAEKQGWGEVTVKFPNGYEIAIRRGEGEIAASPTPQPSRPRLGWGGPQQERQDQGTPSLAFQPSPEYIATQARREAEREKRAGVVQEILRDGAWKFGQPLKDLAAELAKRGYLNWRYDDPPRPMYSTDVKELLALALQKKEKHNGAEKPRW